MQNDLNYCLNEIKEVLEEKFIVAYRLMCKEISFSEDDFITKKFFKIRKNLLLLRFDKILVEAKKVVIKNESLSHQSTRERDLKLIEREKDKLNFNYEKSLTYLKRNVVCTHRYYIRRYPYLLLYLEAIESRIKFGMTRKEAEKDIHYICYKNKITILKDIEFDSYIQKVIYKNISEKDMFEDLEKKYNVSEKYI